MNTMTVSTTRAGCEQGAHVYRNGYCRHCGAQRPHRRFCTQEDFQRLYLGLMREEAMEWRQAAERFRESGDNYDSGLAVGHLAAASMWRSLARKARR